MRTNRKSNFFAAGFTVVELLVVLGIIGLLLAMLLPALNRARQSAQKVTCAAKLRTLGQLLVLHANDHKGYMPLGGNIAPGTGTENPDDPATLGDTSRQLYDYYDNDVNTVCVTAMPAALAPYIAQAVRDDSWQDVDADIQAPGPIQNSFICPCDENTINRTYTAPQWIHNVGTATFLNGWSSYGINAEVFAWTDVGNNGTTGHSRARGKLAIIPHSSQTMLMCDTNSAIEVWVLGAQMSLADVYLGTNGTVGSDIVFDPTRHNGSMNILFADGHVDSKLILSNGKTKATGAVGTPGNTPSGDLMSVSMDKDFR